MKLLSTSLLFTLLIATLASCKKNDYAEIVGGADIWIKNATDQPLRDISIRTRGYYGDGSTNTDSTGFSLLSPGDSIQLSIGLKLRSQGSLLLRVKSSEKELQANFADFSSSSTYNPKSKVTVFRDTIIVERTLVIDKR